MDINIIGWIVLGITNIVVVAFMYGKTSQKVSQCVKAIENGLIEQVQEHDSRLTRVETIIENQETQLRQMNSKLDMLIQQGIKPVEYPREVL